ncbi:DinB family protein [Thermaerobacter litoralis]
MAGNGKDGAAVAPFLRGRVEGAGLLPSVWWRGLQEVREMADRWAGDLEADAFWWVPGAAMNPIGGLLRHIAGSSLRLLCYAVGEPVPDELRARAREELPPSPELEPAAVLRQFHEEMGRVQDRILRLTDADLAATRTVGRQQVPAEAAFILHHLVEHAQHHMGQIIVLRKLWNARHM